MAFTRTVTVSSGSSSGSYSKTRTITAANQLTLTDTLPAPILGCTANATTEVITSPAAHGLSTGREVQVSVAYTGAGALPTGLSANTTYYFIKVTDTTFKLASTRANALAGTAINITVNGGAFAIVPVQIFTANIPLIKADGTDALKWLAFKVSASHSGSFVFTNDDSLVVYDHIVSAGSDFIFPGTQNAQNGGVSNLHDDWTSASSSIAEITVVPYVTGGVELDVFTSPAELTIDALFTNDD